MTRMGRAHNQAQMGYQAGNAHADASLAQHLPLPGPAGSALQLLTERTPAPLEDMVFNDLNRRRWRAGPPTCRRLGPDAIDIS